MTALALGVVGCGGDDNGDSGSSGSSGASTAASGDTGGGSSAIVAEAKKAVAQGKVGYPETYDGPTEKVKVPQGLTLAVMPCGAAVRGCVALTDAAADVGKKLGWTVKQYDGKADPSNQNRAMLQATAAGADIILTGGTEADAIRSGLQAARKKGIIVASMSQAEVPEDNGYYFDINPAGPEMGKLAGDWMIADSGGKAVFQPWIDKEFGGAVQYLEGNIARVKECSTCEVKDPEQFVAASLATDFGPRTVNVVRQNKDIQYMNPSYDPAAAAQATALSTAGLKDVKIMGLNGNTQSLDLVSKGQVQVADIAYDQVYVGWLAVYQAIRLYDKMPLWTGGASDEVHKYSGTVPYKLFLQDNVPTPIKEWVDTRLGWQDKIGGLMGIGGGAS